MRAFRRTGESPVVLQPPVVEAVGELHLLGRASAHPDGAGELVRGGG